MKAKLIQEKLDETKAKYARTIDLHIFKVWLYFVVSDSGDVFDGIYDLLIKTQGNYTNDTTKMRLKNDQKHA